MRREATIWIERAEVSRDEVFRVVAECCEGAATVDCMYASHATNAGIAFTWLLVASRPAAPLDVIAKALARALDCKTLVFFHSDQNQTAGYQLVAAEDIEAGDAPDGPFTVRRMWISNGFITSGVLSLPGVPGYLEVERCAFAALFGGDPDGRVVDPSEGTWHRIVVDGARATADREGDCEWLPHNERTFEIEWISGARRPRDQPSSTSTTIGP